MHILFANFSFDEENAEALALKLINSNINLNLIDNNGLTPIHVAIKKNQTRALEFAK
jgi:ankyrin repeat protein